MLLNLTRGGQEVANAIMAIARGNLLPVSVVGMDGKVRNARMRPAISLRLAALDLASGYLFGKPVQAVAVAQKVMFAVRHDKDPRHDPLARVIPAEARLVQE